MLYLVSLGWEWHSALEWFGYFKVRGGKTQLSSCWQTIESQPCRKLSTDSCRVFLKAVKTNHWKVFFFLVFSDWSDIKFQVIFAYCIFTKNIKGKWHWLRRRICVAWDVVWEKILIHTLRPQAYGVKLTPPNGKQTLFSRSSISMDPYNSAQRGKRLCSLAPLIHNNKYIDRKF